MLLDTTQDLARALERMQHLIVRTKAPSSAAGKAAQKGDSNDAEETIAAKVREVPAVLELTFLHNQVLFLRWCRFARFFTRICVSRWHHVPAFPITCPFLVLLKLKKQLLEYENTEVFNDVDF